MPPRLYATDDVVASIHKAHGEFTHVLVNRSYTTIKPVLLQSEKIHVEPIYVWAEWEPTSLAQLERWRADGGVLFDRNWAPDKSGSTDVLLFAECPLAVERIARAVSAAREYVVIARPHTWRVHEEAIDLQAPPVELLQEIWKHCRGQRITDLELADATGIPASCLQYMRGRFKPVCEWDMKPRLAPESAALLPAWSWVAAGRSSLRKEVRLSGHQTAVKELARLGHIEMTKYHRYPSTEPRWAALERRRAEALAQLAAVRSLLASIPSHLDA